MVGKLKEPQQNWYHSQYSLFKTLCSFHREHLIVETIRTENEGTGQKIARALLDLFQLHLSKCLILRDSTKSSINLFTQLFVTFLIMVLFICLLRQEKPRSKLILTLLAENSKAFGQNFKSKQCRLRSNYSYRSRQISVFTGCDFSNSYIKFEHNKDLFDFLIIWRYVVCSH